MAEQVGFEPTEDYSAFASLAGRWIKPLSHCSICKWGFRTHAVSHLAPSKDRYDYTMRCVRTPRPMMVGTPMRFKLQGSFTFSLAASTRAGTRDGSRTRTLLDISHRILSSRSLPVPPLWHILYLYLTYILYHIFLIKSIKNMRSATFSFGSRVCINLSLISYLNLISYFSTNALARS